MVRYKFDADVDDTRKEAFRAAAADWRTHTCIAVVEDDNAETWFIDLVRLMKGSWLYCLLDLELVVSVLLRRIMLKPHKSDQAWGWGAKLLSC